MLRALAVVVVLWGGCEVEVGGIDPVSVEHSGAVSVSWPEQTEIAITICEPPAWEIVADQAIADVVDAAPWPLPRCSVAPGDEAVWLRPPPGCGTFLQRRSDGAAWCIGAAWEECP